MNSRLFLVLSLMTFNCFSTYAADERLSEDSVEAIRHASMTLSDPDNNNVAEECEEGMVGSIEVDFKGNQTLFQLAMCIHTMKDFEALDKRTKRQLVKLYPDFQQFLEINDKIGEQLNTEMIEFSPRSCRAIVLLESPIFEAQVPEDELANIPYVACTPSRRIVRNPSDEVKRILRSEIRRRTQKQELEESALARFKKSLRDKLR